MKNNFRMIIAERKLSMKKIERDTGISYSTLSRLKREEGENPDIRHLITLAKYFNIGLDDLIEIE